MLVRCASSTRHAQEKANASKIKPSCMQQVLSHQLLCICSRHGQLAFQEILRHLPILLFAEPCYPGVCCSLALSVHGSIKTLFYHLAWCFVYWTSTRMLSLTPASAWTSGKPHPKGLNGGRPNSVARLLMHAVLRVSSSSRTEAALLCRLQKSQNLELLGWMQRL